MLQPIFITGIGTGVGKTLVSAIVTEALQADYWKPVQAGYEDGTDSGWIKDILSNSSSVVHPELYQLKMAVSPHIAAREENKLIDLHEIKNALEEISLSLQDRHTNLVVEGAGGLLVPLNENEFVADLIKQLQAKVILVSRNYLGSINHSLLTAEVCRYYKLDVIGWIFNDQYLAYEEEIMHWSSFPKIGSIPFTANPDKKFILDQARLIAEELKKII
ncbi:MAG: dethiobiotin synthase [Bacteroidota bacterium]